MCTNFEYQMHRIYAEFKDKAIKPSDLLNKWDDDQQLIIRVSLGGITPERFIEDMRENGYLSADSENRLRLTPRGEHMLEFVERRVGA